VYFHSILPDTLGSGILLGRCLRSISECCACGGKFGFTLIDFSLQLRDLGVQICALEIRFRESSFSGLRNFELHLRLSQRSLRKLNALLEIQQLQGTETVKRSSRFDLIELIHKEFDMAGKHHTIFVPGEGLQLE